MNEAAALASNLGDGHWGWLDWAILGGLVFILLAFVVVMLLFSKNLFQRQLAVLVKATDERSRTLYLEHLPVINETIEREVDRLEELYAEGWQNHDKDILFLLKEMERLETLITGVVPSETMAEVQLSKQEETAQALKILLARIRRETL